MQTKYLEFMVQNPVKAYEKNMTHEIFRQRSVVAEQLKVVKTLLVQGGLQFRHLLHEPWLLLP
jgi:uncharacterized protein YceH (UPF0502 family)